MKSYSGKGIFDPKLARERRKVNSMPPQCPSYDFQFDDGRIGWQLEQSFAVCMVKAHSTIRQFEGSTEEWFDGKPLTVWHLSDSHIATLSEALGNANR